MDAALTLVSEFLFFFFQTKSGKLCMGRGSHHVFGRKETREEEENSEISWLTLSRICGRYRGLPMSSIYSSFGFECKLLKNLQEVF